MTSSPFPLPTVAACRPKNPPRIFLQSDRNAEFRCAALSGGNSFSMDRDNVRTRPDVLVSSSRTQNTPCKRQINVLPLYMACIQPFESVLKLGKKTNKQTKITVRPSAWVSVQSIELKCSYGAPKNSLNATRLTLSRTKSRRRGSRLGVRRRIQKVLVAGILAVDSVPSISDGPK